MFFCCSIPLRQTSGRGLPEASECSRRNSCFSSLRSCSFSACGLVSLSFVFWADAMGSTIRPRCIPPATTARIVAAPNKTHPLRALGIFTIGILHLCVLAGAPVLLPFRHQQQTHR